MTKRYGVTGIEMIVRFLTGSDRRLLVTILTSKVVWTLAVLLVVARVTPLRDSELYLSWTLGDFSSTVMRTVVIGNATALLKRVVFGSDWMVHALF